MTHTPADLAIHRAQLADMDEQVICAYLRERGWLVEWPGAVLFARVGGRDRLPAGYPPLADYDPEVLPFDSERDYE
jgi:hypothetical protein